MLEIKITGLKEAIAAVDDAVKNKIPILVSIALTETAKGLKAEIEKKLPQVFDRPTRWTLNSMMMMSANYKDVNPSAYVWFKDKAEKGTPAAEYLSAEIFGEGRRLKKYKVALNSAGILPDGYYTVPARDVPLDNYGNMSQRQIVQILTAMKSLREMPTIRGRLVDFTKRAGTKDYFLSRPGVRGSTLAFGIWIKTTNAVGRGKQGPQHGGVRPVLMFIKRAPQYRVRLPFFEWTQAYIDVELPRAFKRLVAERLTHMKAKV